jgi:hypothetical protein
MLRMRRRLRSAERIRFVVGSKPGGQSALQLWSVRIETQATRCPASRIVRYVPATVMSSFAVSSFIRRPVAFRQP